jgi:hypothetical protein
VNNEETIVFLEEQLVYYASSLDSFRSYFDEVDKIENAVNDVFPNIEIAEFNEVRKQLNFLGYLTISLLDLIVITRNIIKSNIAWDRFYQFRICNLAIYESIKSFFQHLQQLKGWVSDNEDLKNTLKHIAKELNNFKQQYNYDTTIKEVRNYTVAHVDRNFTEVYDKIISFNGDEIFAMVLHYLQVLFKLQSLSKDISDHLLAKVVQEGIDTDKRVEDLKNKIQSKIDALKNNRR